MPTRRLLLFFLVAALAVGAPGCRGTPDRRTNVVAAGGGAVEPGTSSQGEGPGEQPLIVEPEPSPLYVYVSGAVAHPGVYQLPPGARGCDALAAAGGSAKDARLELVNLAAPLSDGQQLHIPSRAEAAASTQPGVDTVARGPLNVNRATAGQLVELPGIGVVLAGRIIAYRAEHGPFANADELLAVPGIGESRLKDIRPLISFGP